MATDPNDSKEKTGSQNSTSKPDQETLHTTDPQEHMKGPLSSLMNMTDDSFKEEGSKKGTED